MCVCVCFPCTPIKRAVIKPFADGEVAKVLSEASNQNHLGGFPSSLSPAAFLSDVSANSGILMAISEGAGNVTPLMGQIKRHTCRKTSKCRTEAFEHAYK